MYLSFAEVSSIMRKKTHNIVISVLTSVYFDSVTIVILYVSQGGCASPQVGFQTSCHCYSTVTVLVVCPTYVRRCTTNATYKGKTF